MIPVWIAQKIHKIIGNAALKFFGSALNMLTGID